MATMNFFCKTLEQDGKNFLIEPFQKLDMEQVLLSNKEYVWLTPEAYTYVVQELDLEHREPRMLIYIDGEIDASKVYDVSDLIKVEQLQEETDEDVLDAYKEKTLRMINELISNQLMISNFELYHFFKLNHYLEAKGFFITDENREEKYLEVINSGDTETLEKLSEYLDSLDDFNAIDAVYMKYKEYKEKIKAAKTKQEISEAYYELSGKLF
jgi:hypothetical protein